MKNQKEIYKALLAGKTLISTKDGTLVYLVTGTLVEEPVDYNPMLSNESFLRPNLWSIYKKNKNKESK